MENDPARRLLAAIEADIQRTQASIARAQGEGVEHFARRLEAPTEANLDGWAEQAGAMAQVQGNPDGR